MLRSTLAKRAWPLLLAAICFSYVYGLWRAPLVGADEPRYAEVTREMYARGDLVTPTLGGRAWFEKPALVYWLGIGSYELFGVGEWQARLGAMLLGLLTLLCAVWLARTVEAAESDRLAGFSRTLCGLLATCAGLIAFARVMNFDVAVTWTVTAALACFFGAELEQDEGRRRWLLAGCYAVGMVAGLQQFATRIDNSSYDSMSRYRSVTWPPQSVVVAVNEDTLRARGGMQHIREIDVVNKVAFSTQQAWIFYALDGGTKPACCHHSTSRVAARRRSAASLTASTIF